MSNNIHIQVFKKKIKNLKRTFSELPQNTLYYCRMCSSDGLRSKCLKRNKATVFPVAKLKLRPTLRSISE